MRYSIVSSSKGGTGKSSLSLALAIHYDHANKKKSGEKVELLSKWSDKDFSNRVAIIKYYDDNGKFNANGKEFFGDDNIDYPIITYDSSKNAYELTAKGKKYLKQKLKECEDSFGKSTSCLIDLDLLGTTLEQSLFHDKIIKNKYIKNNKDYLNYLDYIVDKNKIADKYLNDIVRHDFKNTDEIVTKIKLPYSRMDEKDDGAITEKADIDILFASSSAGDKEHFRKHSSTMSVAENVFANELKKILLHLEQSGYEHIIIDMPPASDLYSSCIYDLLLRNKNKDNTVDLYCISTDDSAQVNVCHDSLQSFLDNDNYYLPDRIIFAINKTLLSHELYMHVYPTPIIDRNYYNRIDVNIYNSLCNNLKDLLLKKSYYISFAKCDKYSECVSFGGDNSGLYRIKIWGQTSMCTSLERNGLIEIINDGIFLDTSDGKVKLDENKVNKIELR